MIPWRDAAGSCLAGDVARPEDEAGRLDALARYAILDTPPEGAFDDIVRLASLTCGTPIALVSLVDAGRQWFKARVGLDVDETPRNISFCDHAIRRPDGPLIVPDARADPRFMANPLVTGEPQIRAYAGMPLVTPGGHAIGTLCVIDRKPREFTAEQSEALQALGRQVVARLELRLRVAELQGTVRDLLQSEATLREETSRREAILEAALDAIVTIDHEGSIIEYNSAAERTFGYARAEAMGRPMVELMIPPVHREAHLHGMACLQATGASMILGRRVEVVAMRKGGSTFPAELAIAVIRRDGPSAYTAYLRDITERRRTADALRASEERFALAARGTDDGIWDWDIRTGAVYYSPRFSELLGWAKAEVDGTLDDWKEQVHPEDRDRVIAALADHFERRTPYVIEYRLRGTDDEYRWVMARGQAVWDEFDRPVRMAGSIADIAVRRRAEEALRRSEAEARKLAMVADRTDNAVVLTQPDGRIEWVNDGFTRITGYSLAEVAGQSPGSRLQGPETDPAVVAHMRDQIGRGEGFHVEVINYAKSGRKYWMAIEAQPIRGDDGELIHFMAIQSDITERKRTEERLREQAALLDVSRDAILVRGLDGRIAHWNRGAERLYGWTAADAIGRDADDLLVTRPGPMLEQARADTLDEGGWAGELSQSARDGRELVVQSRWSLARDERGRPRSILIVNTDVTETKQLESRSFRAQRMEALGRLAGGVSHDLNNVLTPITMAVDLLQLRAADPASRAILETLRKNAERGAGMVRQILAFARGVEGRRVWLEVGPLIGEVERMLRPTMPKSIAIAVECQQGLRGVRADETQLCQVLMNLCVNARDAMPEGGSLTISVVNVELDDRAARHQHGARAGPHVLISVEDTGGGIPEEVVDKIFDPFFTTKPLGQGTGLGLSTVLGIVKGHGGFVAVDSRPGRGTRFSIYLPAADPTPREPSPPGPDLPRGDGQTILVIDDEAPILEVTGGLLEACGYRALTAGTGEEAVELFSRRRGEIAAVITDMMMPVMDGPATILALERVDPHVRIIASSGVQAVRLAEPLPRPVKAFLPKPYTAVALLATLREVLATT